MLPEAGLNFTLLAHILLTFLPSGAKKMLLVTRLPLEA
jgi:hypothetical protein